MKTMMSLVLLGALSGSMPVAAGAAQQVRVVAHGDLDLASVAGRSALDTRIRLAIESACGIASDLDLSGRNAVRRCRNTARQEVAVQRLRAIVAARYPATPAAAILQASASEAGLTPSR